MKHIFNSVFEVPEIATDVLDSMVTKEEMKLITTFEKTPFSIEQVAFALSLSNKVAIQLVHSAYKRGLINRVDETSGLYKSSTFYHRLDIFAITETKAYTSLPKEKRQQLDAWYFQAYLDSLEKEVEVPTLDVILTLEETLQKIEQEERPIWLNPCDCRILAGNCFSPVNTCITYKSGINTLSHRGWSQELTKEEAKEVVKKADKAGLMHTANPNGICHCCQDCCYLFRAQEARSANPNWPASSKIAKFDKDSCIHCGRCNKRCHFKAFTKKDGIVSYDKTKCRGCGLCRDTCPVKAITMIERG